MRMKIARWFCFVCLIVGLRASFAATTFKAGLEFACDQATAAPRQGAFHVQGMAVKFFD
jgi:hypothetical protein